MVRRIRKGSVLGTLYCCTTRHASAPSLPAAPRPRGRRGCSVIQSSFTYRPDDTASRRSGATGFTKGMVRSEEQPQHPGMALVAGDESGPAREARSTPSSSRPSHGACRQHRLQAVPACGIVPLSRYTLSNYGPQSRFLSLHWPGRRAGCRFVAASSSKKVPAPGICAHEDPASLPSRNGCGLVPPASPRRWQPRSMSTSHSQPTWSLASDRARHLLWCSSQTISCSTASESPDSPAVHRCLFHLGCVLHQAALYHCFLNCRSSLDRVAGLLARSIACSISARYSPITARAHQPSRPLLETLPVTLNHPHRVL